MIHVDALKWCQLEPAPTGDGRFTHRCTLCGQLRKCAFPGGRNCRWLCPAQALETIAATPRTSLAAPLPYARQHTIIRELAIASEHNTFHIGEFAILRQIMGTWPARR